MTENKKQTIRWVIFHEPIDLFLRTANAFSDEIKKLTNGRLEIEVYTVNEYAEKFHNGVRFDPSTLIKSGEVQMSQCYIATLGAARATDFYALEMPFLFKDHDHVSRVLEGKIGKTLLEETLPQKTSMRGLAFTYSGGYRVMASNKKIHTKEDLKGLTVGVKTNPIFADMCDAFGCNYESIPELLQPLTTSEEDLKNQLANVNTVQTTLPRYSVEARSDIHKHVTNTKHSIYLTTIVINEQFWNSLSIDDQMVLRQSAFNSARKERVWSVEDAEKISNSKTEQEKLGIASFNELSIEESKKLKDSVQGMYEKYTKFFTPGLIESILKS